jgi:catalase
MWDGEDTRPTVELGRLLVRSVADAKICDETIFAPTILADGIDGPENDPMFAIRTPAYAISITKRANRGGSVIRYSVSVPLGGSPAG